MSIFSRLFKIGQAEANTVVNRLEDPIKMTEQGIRDLKRDLQGAISGLAEVKSVSVRLSKEAEDSKRQVGEYERKAMLLLQQAQDGKMELVDAERLATEALARKETIGERAVQLSRDAEQQQRMAAQLQETVQKLKSTITTHENELITLRARAKTAESSKKINQQLAKIDSSGTIAMLERMKDKVEEDEALAQAYGDVANIETSVDAEIDRALAGAGTTSADDRLAELKRKMGLNSPGGGSV